MSFKSSTHIDHLKSHTLYKKTHIHSLTHQHLQSSANALRIHTHIRYTVPSLRVYSSNRAYPITVTADIRSGLSTVSCRFPLLGCTHVCVCVCVQPVYLLLDSVTTFLTLCALSLYLLGLTEKICGIESSPCFSAGAREQQPYFSYIGALN